MPSDSAPGIVKRIADKARAMQEAASKVGQAVQDQAAPKAAAPTEEAKAR